MLIEKKDSLVRAALTVSSLKKSYIIKNDKTKRSLTTKKSMPVKSMPVKSIVMMVIAWPVVYGLLGLSSHAVSAPKVYGDAIVSEVRSIYDGDSFKVHIEGWPDIIGKSMGIRVAGVDTPEMRGKCPQEKKLAQKAKKHTVAMLRQGRVVELRNMQRGKYFRIVASVYIDGVSLSDSLIDAKLAYPYNGGKKQSWCKKIKPS